MYPKLTWIILPLFLATVSACTREHPAGEAAAKSLDALRRLASEENYRKLGFESLEEIERIKLGTPIPVYFVGLESLQKFDPGDDPNTLITQPHEMIYPVLVDDNVRCSLGMKERGGQWQVRTYGRPNVSRALAKVRDDHAASGSRSQADYFAVEIPALYLIFIGHRTGGALLLTHVHDHEDLGFNSGQTAPAAEVFAKISAAAKDFKGPLPAAL